MQNKREIVKYLLIISLSLLLYIHGTYANADSSSSSSEENKITSKQKQKGMEQMGTPLGLSKQALMGKWKNKKGKKASSSPRDNEEEQDRSFHDVSFHGGLVDSVLNMFDLSLPQSRSLGGGGGGQVGQAPLGLDDKIQNTKFSHSSAVAGNVKKSTVVPSTVYYYTISRDRHTS